MKTRVIESRSLGAKSTVVASATLTVPEIGPWLGRIYGEITRYLSGIGEHPAGPPFARYHRLEGERFEVEAGFPVNRHLRGFAELRGSSLPAGTIAVTTHVGPYDEMGPSYEALATWIASRGGVPLGDPWEIYYSEPSEPPETWRTDILQPYRPA
jgi:effector-binding domain-containing protein